MRTSPFCADTFSSYSAVWQAKWTCLWEKLLWGDSVLVLHRSYKPTCAARCPAPAHTAMPKTRVHGGENLLSVIKTDGACHIKGNVHLSPKESLAEDFQANVLLQPTFSYQCSQQAPLGRGQLGTPSQLCQPGPFGYWPSLTRSKVWIDTGIPQSWTTKIQQVLSEFLASLHYSPTLPFSFFKGKMKRRKHRALKLTRSLVSGGSFCFFFLFLSFYFLMWWFCLCTDTIYSFATRDFNLRFLCNCQNTHLDASSYGVCLAPSHHVR